MADPIRQYQQARRRRDRAEEAVAATVAGVRYAAILLENWRGLEVRHPEFFGPKDGSMPLDASDWPTIEHLVKVLSEWHRAEQSVKRAWTAIPDADREGLRLPGA